MIIKTRYRDIPFDDVRKCQKSELTHPDACTDWEQRLRGQTIEIETPPHAGNFYAACTGPFYRVTGGRRHISGHTMDVCPHIAEIGD